MDAPNIIRRLPSHVIDRIAAGEVIERPASVVKELLENAIDAGASQVDVEIEQGGLARIVISDDGRGMSPDDARVAVERHATSKLRTADDLFAIATYGFRGEALSSIAAVSRLTLTTRRPQDDVGTRVVLEGGEFREDGAVGCPVGTTIDVADLFFNTPARRKFMRSAATEQAHVLEACVRGVLGGPMCGLLVTSGSRRLLDVPPADRDVMSAANCERALALLRGKADSLYPFEHQHEGIAISGYLSAPRNQRRDARGVWFFINGRYVRDRTLQRALLDAYGSHLTRGQYPVCVVRLQMNPAAVDVNVHPQKLEVRFSDSGSIYRAVQSAVTRALAETPWETTGGLRRVPSTLPLPTVGRAPPLIEVFGAGSVGAYGGVPSGAPYAMGEKTGLEPGLAFGGLTTARDPGGLVTREAPEEERGLDAAGASPRSKDDPPAPLVVGKFLLGRVQGSVWVINLAHWRRWACERRLRTELAAGTVVTQPLLFPEVIALSRPCWQWLERHWETLPSFGFELEPVGPERYALRAIPAAIGGEGGARELCQQVVSALMASSDHASDPSVRERIADICARHAQGLATSHDQTRGAMEALVEMLRGEGSPEWARPVRAEDLERLF